MTIADLVARNTALSSEVRRSHEALKIAQLTIDKMKVELTYLRDVLERLPTHLNSAIEELLPHRWQPAA